MQAVCPITEKRINERVSRLNAVVTVLFTLFYIAFNFWGGMLFLLIDFFIRGFFDNRYSLVCQFNKWFVTRFNIGGKTVNAGPKIFAAQVGTVLSALTLLAYFANYYTLSIAVGGILAFFSILEAGFGICVACKLYPLVRKIK